MIPVTHFYALHGLSDRVRQSILNEFAAVGGKHLVLTDHCVAQIMTDTAFAQKLKADEGGGTDVFGCPCAVRCAERPLLAFR